MLESLDVSTLASRLRDLLASGKPGLAAQRNMVPALAYGRHAGPPAWDARRAAVLIGFCRRAGAWRIPLTLRPRTMEAHGGQVSLPGGVVESGESDDQCARRELEEELGVSPDCVEIVGQLSPLYVFGSNCWVHPQVAVLRPPTEITPNPAEVERVLWLNPGTLVDRRRRRTTERRHRGIRFRAPHWSCDGALIWGATAMILAELIEAIGWPT